MPHVHPVTSILLLQKQIIGMHSTSTARLNRWYNPGSRIVCNSADLCFLQNALYCLFLMDGKVARMYAIIVAQSAGAVAQQHRAPKPSRTRLVRAPRQSRSKQVDTAQLHCTIIRSGPNQWTNPHTVLKTPIGTHTAG